MVSDGLGDVSTNAPCSPPATTGRRRICLLSEDLSGNPDEGVKNTALSLAGALERHHDVVVLATEGATPLPKIRLVSSSRTFLGTRLRAVLVTYRPEVLLYVPRSSTTFASFVRGRVLKGYCPDAKLVLVGLQARQLNRVEQRLVPFLRPNLVLVQSQVSKRYLERLGFLVEILPSGVDLQRFRPVGPARRAQLRARYHIGTERPVVLHVGHLQAGRGIQVLADLAIRRLCQVVLVVSTSTRREAELAEVLRRSGVLVIDQYVPNVEHLYQIADCYVFPVESTDHAIEMPLSVLEAFGCDLPVVTTPFAGMIDCFGWVGSPGLRFVDSRDELIREAERQAASDWRGTRCLAEPYSWNHIADRVLGPMLSRTTGRS